METKVGSIEVGKYKDLSYWGRTCSMLLLGVSGADKTLVARTIHCRTFAPTAPG